MGDRLAGEVAAPRADTGIFHRGRSSHRDDLPRPRRPAGADRDEPRRRIGVLGAVRAQPVHASLVPLGPGGRCRPRARARGDDRRPRLGPSLPCRRARRRPARHDREADRGPGGGGRRGGDRDRSTLAGTTGTVAGPVGPRRARGGGRVLRDHPRRGPSVLRAESQPARDHPPRRTAQPSRHRRALRALRDSAAGSVRDPGRVVVGASSCPGHRGRVRRGEDPGRVLDQPCLRGGDRGAGDGPQPRVGVLQRATSQRARDRALGRRRGPRAARARARTRKRAAAERHGHGPGTARPRFLSPHLHVAPIGERRRDGRAAGRRRAGADRGDRPRAGGPERSLGPGGARGPHIHTYVHVDRPPCGREVGATDTAGRRSKASTSIPPAPAHLP